MLRLALLHAAAACWMLGALTCSAHAGGLRVGTADTMVKVPRDGTGALAREALRAIRWGQGPRVELARGEFESAQIVLAAPVDRPLRDVRVTLGALRRGDAEWPGGAHGEAAVHHEPGAGQPGV
jgi:hypothetical protein